MILHTPTEQLQSLTITICLRTRTLGLSWP